MIPFDLRKFLTSIIVLLMLWGLFAAWRSYERKIGALEARSAQLEANAKQLAQRADSLAAAYKPESVTVVRLKQRWDTLTRELHLTDTLHLRDTIMITREVLIRADQEITACTLALATCDRRVATEHQRYTVADSLWRVEKSLRPSWVARWGERVLWSAAGYGLAKLTR